MPYSFTEVEKAKSWIIGLVFFILILIYFAAAWAVASVFKIFYLKTTHPFLTPGESLLVLLIALAAGLIHWYFSIQNLISKILTSLGAKDLDPGDGYHQMFQNILEEVSVACGGKKVEGVVIPTSSLNAFAVSDYSGRNVIGITEGLLARLKRHQLEAVVGHEMAHIVSGDSLTTTVICSLFGLYQEILNVIRRGLAESNRIRTSSRQGGFPLVIGIVYIILAIVVGLSNLLKMFISRQREYRADAVAIRLTRDPLGLAEALYIISRNWRGTGIRGEGLAPLFILNPQYHTLDESEGLFPALFSTHPPIKTRIDIALNIAHAGPAELDNALKKKIKPVVEKEEAPLVLAKEKKNWLIYRDGKWEGPWPIENISALNFLRPDTWVKEAQSQEIKPAYQDEDLRNVFQKTATPGLSALPCPHCHEALATSLYERAPIHYCTYCDGKLLEQDKIVRILAREERPFSKEVVRMAGIIKKETLTAEPKLRQIIPEKFSSPACPRCQRPMDRKFYSLAYHIEIDRCLYCGLSWFDKWELEVLQYLVETSR